MLEFLLSICAVLAPQSVLRVQVVDDDGEDVEIMNLVVAKNSELDALARAVAVDRLVERLAFMDFAAVRAQHQIALAQPCLFSRASRQHARDDHMLAQRVGV